jgi:hypothetical protein
LVKKGELKPLDLISDDEGYTWHKVYQMKSIQGLTHQSAALPEAPSEESFLLSHEEAAMALSAEADPINEGLLSLAHAGHRKTNAALDLEGLTAFKESAPLMPQNRSWWMASSVAVASLAGLIFWASAPAPEAVSLVSVDTEEMVLDEGSSLLNSGTTRPVRRPASTRPNRISPPTAMQTNSSRRDLMDYRDTHDTDREIPEPAEPMDVDPYGNENQIVQDDAGQNDGAQEQTAARAPAAPDDGYRLEEPNPAETGPIVEEVGDF